MPKNVIQTPFRLPISIRIRCGLWRIFEKQGGISFLLISFTHKDEFYYLRHQKLMEFWNRMETGGRKSFRYEELEKDFFLKGKGVILVPYLDGIQKDLEIRE